MEEEEERAGKRIKTEPTSGDEDGQGELGENEEEEEEEEEEGAGKRMKTEPTENPDAEEQEKAIELFSTVYHGSYSMIPVPAAKKLLLKNGKFRNHSSLFRICNELFCRN